MGSLLMLKMIALAIGISTIQNCEYLQICKRFSNSSNLIQPLKNACKSKVNNFPKNQKKGPVIVNTKTHSSVFHLIFSFISFSISNIDDVFKYFKKS